MNSKLNYLLVLLMMFVLAACGTSSTTSNNNNNNDTGIQIVGSAEGLSTSPNLIKHVYYADYNDDAGLCPDETGGGVSANIDPSTYKVALKKMVLLGDSNENTSDYSLFSATDIEDAYLADFVSDTIFFSSTSYPPAGTYNGILIELYYVEMTIPMTVPALDEESADYRTRGYFTDVGLIEKRDVTIFDSEDNEYWIDRDTDHGTPYDAYAVEDDDRPTNVLDLWADDNFWERDPVTIDTTDTFAGSGFTFAMADDAEALVIPESASGLYTIAMDFDVSQRFTFWEYLENGLESDADGEFTVGYDCGYRILFPDVTVAILED